MLTLRGAHWLITYDSLILVVPAAALGVIKSRYILDNSARKSIERITKLKDGTCLGAVFPVKTWLLVLVMIEAGILLRNSPVPRPAVGFLYITVGIALLITCRIGWRSVRSR